MNHLMQNMIKDNIFKKIIKIHKFNGKICKINNENT
jgi:hypothetical protein